MATPADRARDRQRVRSARGRGEPPRSDLSARIIAALPAIAFAIFIVVQGGVVFTVGVLLLGLVCLHELYAMTDEVDPVRLGGFLGLAGLCFAALYGDQFHVLLAGAAAVVLVFGFALVQARRPGVLGIAVTLFGLAWIGVAVVHAILLRELPNGAGILVDVLVGTFVGDTAAYLGGRAFGRRPLAPGISPNKTVEGLVCGMAGAVVATWLAGTYQDWLSGTDALLLGLGIAVAAPVGDLFESFLKRDVAVKDTGRLFGPHGGALDRLDAAFFTLVVGFYVWSALL